ncbi:MAG: NrdJb, partial [Gammaproteobacteria bacterium]|nr:NrdJb [Gammaproteobacteria bacterium]
ISAVFRKGGDVTFLVDELRSVFDPRGGYFKKGGKYKPSLVAEIGDAIECHMKMIGMIEDDGMNDAQRKMLDAKRKEYDAINGSDKEYNETTSADGEKITDFPANALLCKKCHTKAVISMDGCMTCLNCGDSKCG